MSLSLKVFHQSLPLAQVFRISRGAKTSAEVIVVVISDGTYTGWGESVPYHHYGESINSVRQQILQLSKQNLVIADHNRLDTLLPPGSARNAVDCAMWDLTAKIRGTKVNELLALPAVEACITAQTISLGSLQSMQNEAKKLHHAPLIKVKLDGQSVVSKMQAIHSECPNSRFIIDANEAWTISLLAEVLPALEHCNLALIEQPLPADQDEGLLDFRSSIPLFADESCHSTQGLTRLVGKYQGVNIKLDKTGGLSAALTLLHKAKALEFDIMIGCMVGSSLAMAPAFLLSALADYVDLDGPLLVAKDRTNKFSFNNGVMSKLPRSLWGMGNVHDLDPELISLSQQQA
jgi:L-alanine-DL-glutamate epimerase-like enolase superfamily enzyme